MAKILKLQQKIRIAAAQVFQKIIDTKHIIIGKISGINICHAAVHIPLDIINFSLIEHGTDLVKYTVAHFFLEKSSSSWFLERTGFRESGLPNPDAPGTDHCLH